MKCELGWCILPANHPGWCEVQGGPRDSRNDQIRGLSVGGSFEFIIMVPFEMIRCPHWLVIGGQFVHICEGILYPLARCNDCHEWIIAKRLA